ncbi:MAG: decaprenyl-phosphate phosphoribosyltransferase [Chloroflexi bacterium]|nr:decaprenyl-phosphate phosphoribosyltransferase [Chloroflexota bacterium]
MIAGLVRSMRPKQWTKNVVVFAPLVFDVKLFNVGYALRSLAGFILLCLVSGAVYLINDLVDMEKDRQHPRKRFRPIASGEVSRSPAIVTAIAVPAVALPLGLYVHPTFGIILACYLVLQVLYSFWLKNLVIIDVLVIAAGFVLRVAAGVPLVQAERFSPWLYVSMTLLALLIGFGKRRHELVLLRASANAHRQSLQEYNLPLLDHALTIVTASTLMTYALYTFSAPNLPPDHSMMLTIPYVLYAIFRYLYLIHVKEVGGAPEEVLLSDRPLLVAVALWSLTILLIMYVLN